jgi:hypothetical protein
MLESIETGYEHFEEFVEKIENENSSTVPDDGQIADDTKATDDNNGPEDILNSDSIVRIIITAKPNKRKESQKQTRETIRMSGKGPRDTVLKAMLDAVGKELECVKSKMKNDGKSKYRDRNRRHRGIRRGPTLLDAFGELVMNNSGKKGNSQR